MDFWWIWIIAGVIFAIIEIFTPSFVSLAIGVACALTGILSLIPGVGLPLQFIIFSASVVGLIVASRPIAKKLLGNNPKSITNIQAMIGKIGVVTIEIDNDKAQGYAKIGGEEWSARSIKGNIIKVDNKIIVSGLEGNKVLVTNNILSLPEGNSFIDGEDIESIGEPYFTYVKEAKILSNKLIKQINSAKNINQSISEEIESSISHYSEKINYLARKGNTLNNAIVYYKENSPEENKETILEKLKDENLNTETKKEYENAIKLLNNQIESLIKLNTHKDTVEARLKTSLITLRNIQLNFIRLQHITDESAENAINSLNQKTEEIDEYIDLLSDSLKDIDSQI